MTIQRISLQAQESAKKLKDAERLATIGATAGMVGHDIICSLSLDCYIKDSRKKEGEECLLFILAIVTVAVFAILFF